MNALTRAFRSLETVFVKPIASPTAVLLVFACNLARAGSADLLYPPVSSSGHDFNHAPIGQSFKALAATVKGGVFIADEGSFTAWLQQTYPTLPPYPYAIAPSLMIRVDLLQGEGVGGALLDSRVIALAKPFMGFVEVDYAAAGVGLVVGNTYTVLMTDVSGQSYPNGVTGWVVPAVFDYSTGAALPPGAYKDGQPILQGAVVGNDAGIGDNSFKILDVGGTGPAPLVISGTLPYGGVGQLYSAILTASGGVSPYNWFATGLPAGLSLNADTIAGTPTTAGTYNVNVTVVDSNNTSANASYSVLISPDLSCTKPQGAKSSKGKGTVTAVGANFIMVGAKRIDYASCTRISFGGYATAPHVGDRVEWQGFFETNGNIMAQTLTFN
jgi:hypothetical protein